LKKKYLGAIACFIAGYAIMLAGEHQAGFGTLNRGAMAGIFIPQFHHF